MTTTGAMVSSVTVTEAEPVLPAASVAERVIVFKPSTKASEVRVTWGTPSTVQATAIGDAFVSVPSAGFVMTTTGAMVSSVTVTEAEPVLPAASVAERVIVFKPSTKASEVRVTWGTPSTVQSTVIGDTAVSVPFVGAVMTTTGAMVSTVQVNDAGVGSTLLAGSVARTWKVWLPSARPL